MGMEGKARQNLDAAMSLIRTEHFDAAATRLYYAVFQAAVCALENKGRSPGQLKAGADRWGHDIVGGNLGLIVGRDASTKADYKALRGLREKADYYPDPILPAELAGQDRFVDDFHRTVGIA